MKYGAIPTSLIERIALWMGQVPVPVMDALFSIIKARTLMAGVRLGVFEALRARPATVKEIAATCQLNEDCLELLMRTLVYTDYLEQTGESYTLSKLGRKMT